MNVFVFLTCTCFIIYVNTPYTRASVPKHGGSHISISKQKSKPINHYDTPPGGTASTNSRHQISNNIAPPKLLPPLSRLTDTTGDAGRGIKSSAPETNEGGISGSSVGIDVEDDNEDDSEDSETDSLNEQHINDYVVNNGVDVEDDIKDSETDILNEEHINDYDINNDNDDDDLTMQDKYEKIIEEVNNLDLSQEVPGGLKWDPRVSGIADIVQNLLSFITQFKQFYTPVHTSNDECLKDIQIYGGSKNQYKNGTLWSIIMADSWGKITDGFLFGNVHIPGMYEECQDVKAHYVLGVKQPGHPFNPVYDDELRNITGRYCQVQYKFSNKSSSLTRSGTALAFVKVPVPFSYGTCIPNSCTQGDMEESLNVTFGEEGNDGLELVRIVCHEKSSYKDLRDIDKIMLSVGGVLFGLMVVLTLIDLISAQFNMGNFRSGYPFKVIESFSFLANMKKVFTYDPPAMGTITCLPGIRVITMLWIVICHQYETAIDFQANTFDALKYQDPVVTQVVTNGWISVDTFLFVGGLVLSYHMFPSLLSGKLVNPFTIWFKIIIRMTPSIIFLAAFCFTLLRFLAYGPRAYILEELVDKCNTHWWKDSLYINNILFPDNHGHAVNDCLDHCWYTAVHMQLAVVTIFLLLIFAKRKLYGIITTVVCSLAAILIPLSITIAYDLPPSPLWPVSLDLGFEYMWRVYLVPWCRAGPWVVGVWTALVLRSKRLTNINIPRIVVILGYIAAISLGLTIVLGLYPYNHILPDKKWTPTVAVLYGSLARPAWALCVAWVVFTCHTNNAGMVNATLSWAGWRPLGRLTFSMYLVAPIVQVWWSTTLFVPVYNNYEAKLFESVGVLFVSGLAALFLSVLVELPCITLVGLVIPSMLSHRNKPHADTHSLVKVSEEELKDVKLYPSLKETTSELYDEDTGRKWNMTS